MRNVLITGGEGQLGQSFLSLKDFAEGLGLRLFLVGRSQLDITDEDAVSRYLCDNRIDAVVNAAAYTAVDKAESEVENAFLVNAMGAEVLAKCCAQNDSWMTHISTDYVFDGQSESCYHEDSEVNPLSVYGSSKLKGEEAVLRLLPEAAVIRTSWVFSEFGQNFMKTMLRLAHDRDALSIVADQRGAPTYAPHIAELVLCLIHKKYSEDVTASGVFHFTGAPATTWFAFAEYIFEQAATRSSKFAAPKLTPIDTASYPTAAVRPQNSVLGMGKLEQQFSALNNSWQQGVNQALEVLL